MELTQREAACRNITTAEMVEAAWQEQVYPEVIRQGLAEGTIVLPMNKNRSKGRKAVAFGRPLSTKVSASIGLPLTGGQEALEKEKLQVAVAAGADAIIDLSIGVEKDGDLVSGLRRFLQWTLQNCPQPIGSLPIYEVFACRRGGQKGGTLATTVDLLVRRGME
ncbi:hypothetical protein GJ688_01105 [Heliobacillus mobilis]|uniref:Uncharacterized protein n=1 Tax=Heliobacterium mobile TaxID=28064 RepID=A0A6I3SFH4_HELMO|nr:phosphomethylpyrimidine synthase ThiC [Heliobacterium mobile]MTV47576.1 hypothetical protein [Heliobacterium mobile]